MAVMRKMTEKLLESAAVLYARGWTWVEIAELLGVSRGTLYHWRKKRPRMFPPRVRRADGTR